MLLHRSHTYITFGLPQYDFLAVYTVLSINEKVGDCAAYEGIGPVLDPDLEEIRAQGSKISALRAHELFPEIEEQGLRYRR